MYPILGPLVKKKGWPSMLGHRLERKGYNKTQSRREDKICIAVQQRRHHKDSGRCQVQRFLHEFSSQMGEEIQRRRRGQTRRRKNKICGSYNGAEITGDIFSLVRSAIINGLDPRKYFEYCLEHYDDTPAEELVPYYRPLREKLS